MRIVDQKLLAAPRPLRCEYCGRLCGYPTELHHVIPRGMGGANRLDVPENLIALGGAFDCRCHQDAGNGVITKRELFVKVGKRLGTSGLKCRNKVERLLKAPKESKR